MRQPQIDITQAIQKKCPCEHEYFEKAYRIGVVSKMAPGNNTRQDVIVEYPVYLCNNCGEEFKN